MFEFRQKGDYKDLVEFNYDDVKRWLDKANKFIFRINSLTRNMTK